MNLKIVWKTIGTRLDSVLLDCGHRSLCVEFDNNDKFIYFSFISRLLPVSRLCKMASKNPPPPQKKIILSTHASIRMNGRTHSL